MTEQSDNSITSDCHGDEPEHNTDRPTMIDADEAAALLGIHKGTLYDGAKSGEIPCRRIGRRFLFVRETLVAWVRCDRSDPPASTPTVGGY